MNPENVVRAAIYLLRSMGEKPSATRVIELLRVGSSKKRGGMNRGDVCRLMRTILGDRFETVSANSETISEPILSTQETISANSETAPRHHVRSKTIDNDIDKEPAVLPDDPVKPKRQRRVPDAANLAAYRLLDDLKARIGDTPGLPAKDWKARNSDAARSMLASGTLADEWLQFWDAEAERGKRHAVLKWMQEAFSRRVVVPEKVYDVFVTPDTPEYRAHVLAQRARDEEMGLKWG